MSCNSGPIVLGLSGGTATTHRLPPDAAGCRIEGNFDAQWTGRGYLTQILSDDFGYPIEPESTVEEVLRNSFLRQPTLWLD